MRKPPPKQAVNWRCPACGEAHTLPWQLALHLHRSHFPCDPEVLKATRWACPHPACDAGEKTPRGPLSLAVHMETHKSGEGREGRPPCKHGVRASVQELLTTTPTDRLLALDWRMPNRDIGRQFGLSPDDAYRLRSILRARGLDIPDPINRTAERLLAFRRKEVLSLDWSKPNRALAKVLGTSDDAVRCLRKRLHGEGHQIPLRPRGGEAIYTRAALERYMKAGLGRRPDDLVAKEIGETVYRVLRMRLRYHVRLTLEARRSKAEPQRRARTAARVARMRSLASEGRSLKEIAAELDLHPVYVCKIAKAAGLGITRPRRSVDWGKVGKVDWTLPDTENALALGIPATYINGRRRALRAAGRTLPTPRRLPRRAYQRLWKEWERRTRRAISRVRRLARRTLTAHDIADRTGLPHTLVMLILDRFHLPHRPRTSPPRVPPRRARRRPSAGQ